METGTSLHRGSIGTHVGGGSVHRELREVVEGRHWKQSIPVSGHTCQGNLEVGFFPEDPEGYVEKGLETGISLHRGPTGEPAKGPIYQGL